MSLARVAQALGASTNSEATAGYAPVPPPGAPAAEHIDGVCSPSLTRTSQNDDDDGSRDMENGDGGSVEQSSARGCCVDGTLFRVSVIALLCAILLSVWTVLLRDTRLFDAGPLILQHGLLRAHDTPTLNRWALHFLALQKRFELLCNQGSNNRVQNRVDGSYPDAPDEMRRWSVTSKSYHIHMLPERMDAAAKATAMALPKPDSKDSRALWLHPLPLCDTPAALLHSLRFGRRSALEYTKFPHGSVDERGGSPFSPFKDLSFFTPAKCNFRWLTAEQACRVLDAFAYHQWEGDSLVRHTVQALWGLLMGDLRYGMLPRTDPAVKHEACQCDGAFSEHAKCRTGSSLRWGGMLTEPADSAAVRGYCPQIGARGAPLSFRWTSEGMHPDLEQLCDDAAQRFPGDARPILIYFSSGMHQGLNATRIMGRLAPQLQRVQRLKVACAARQRKVFVLFGGLPHQAKLLDARWRHQAPSNMRRVDAVIEAAFARDYPDLDCQYLWWGELYNGAASSDGLHMLTEGNVLKVQYLLNYMALVAEVPLLEQDQDLLDLTPEPKPEPDNR